MDETENLQLLRIEGEVTIASAGEIKSLLLEALTSGKELRVKLDQATELDVTVMQLLYAAQRDASLSGIRFSVEGQLSECLSVAMVDAGFEKLSARTDSK
jgi:anti-anti-sigma regulatory factor